jgi:hypothetical protein
LLAWQGTNVPHMARWCISTVISTQSVKGPAPRSTIRALYRHFAFYGAPTDETDTRRIPGVCAPDPKEPAVMPQDVRGGEPDPPPLCVYHRQVVANLDHLDDTDHHHTANATTEFTRQSCAHLQETR